MNATPKVVVMLYLCVLVGLLGGLKSGIAAVSITNTHPIEGYADKLSASQGESISFSVHVPGTNGPVYPVRFYRYGVDGGPILVAGPFQCNNGAPRDYTDTSFKDGLQWPVSFTLVIPSAPGMLSLPPCIGAFSTLAWPSGIYVARSTDSSGVSRDIATFVVTDTAANRKSIALLASTNTWQAYNYWPGGGHQIAPGVYGSNSFYRSPPGCGPWQPDTEVNFRRPNPYATPEVVDQWPGDCEYTPAYRTEHLVAGEVRVARWFDREGYPVSMLTDYDVHQGWSEATKETALDPYDVVVISTHSEYWSDAMYKSVTAYLDGGGSVVSISGNTAYWRVEIDPAAGKMTGFKIVPDDLWDEMLLAPNPAWSDFVLKRRLLGFQFNPSNVTNCQGWLLTDAAKSGVNKLSHWAFAGIPDSAVLGPTGEIAQGSSRCLEDPSGNVTSGASGEEVDFIAPGFARELTVLGERAEGDALPSHVIYLRRASAGQVFTIGSITASGSLALGDAHLTTLLRNVLDQFSAHAAFSDFGGDGRTDLIGRGASDGKLYRFDGTGAGGLSFPGVPFDSGWSIFNDIVAPGDLDSDGAPDLLARKSDGALLFYRGTGTGTLMQVPSVQIATGWGVYIEIITPGDFDGDGRPDVLGRKADGTIWMHRGNGSGGFTAAATQIESGWQVYIEVMSPGDFNEDGFSDLIARKSDGTLWFYRGNGDGTVNQNDPDSQAFDTGWAGFSRLIAAGDFDGDDVGDVLALTPGGTLYLYYGTGLGTFAEIPGQRVGAVGEFSTLDLLFGVW